MLEASPKGTVPTMVLEDGSVIDESWDIMRWAISIKDPDNWAGTAGCSLDLANSLVEENDGDFSYYAYYFQYASSYPERSHEHDRDKTIVFAERLEKRLFNRRFLDGNKLTIGDLAVFPFVSNLSSADSTWFSGHFGHLVKWVVKIRELPLVKSVSRSHSLWVF